MTQKSNPFWSSGEAYSNARPHWSTAAKTTTIFFWSSGEAYSITPLFNSSHNNNCIILKIRGTHLVKPTHFLSDCNQNNFFIVPKIQGERNITQDHSVWQKPWQRPACCFDNPQVQPIAMPTHLVGLHPSQFQWHSWRLGGTYVLKGGIIYVFRRLCSNMNSLSCLNSVVTCSIAAGILLSKLAAAARSRTASTIICLFCRCEYDMGHPL